MLKDQTLPSESRIHRTTSLDGTELVSTLHGSGPALVLVPAGPGGAETTWRHALPMLAERFTCHLLDSRGRGRSGDHPDRSPERLTEDISTFAESLDEPVGLVEWGSFVGPGWSLFAAQRAPAVHAVASYDPLVIDAASEKEVARLGEVLERTGALVAEGRLREAARSFPAAMAAAGFYTEADMVGGATTEFWSASTENIPVFFDELAQAERKGGPDPANPSQLAEIRVPVLLLHGTRSHPMNVDLVRFVGEHVRDSRVRAISGAGHYGPWTHPDAVVRELVEFFQEVLPRA